MIDINELRRLAQAAISKMNALDPEFVSSVTPLAVLELLERLETAEKSDAESLAMYRKVRDERDALRTKIGRMETRLRLILDEPENTMSNSKAMREMIKQARLALKESK